MSYKATGWAYDLPLTGPAKFVLVALADFADEAGSCYPGQERLAQMTGLNERTIRRALDRLEGMALIRRERRNDARGHRTSDRYYLAVGTQSLPDTQPTGQTAHRAHSPSLPDSESIPTGLSDRVTISRTTRDPSGGAPDAPTPTPDPPQTTVAQKLDDGASPWCRRHPDGTDKPCAACKKARIAWEGPLIAAARGDVRPEPKPVHHIPGLCDAHRQPEAACEMCAYERAHPELMGAGA